MRVLYTGADGYIGAILGPKLLARGHDAVGVDTGFYRRGWLFEDGLTRPMVMTKDVRKLSAADLKGFDAVVHLAELSNDPLSENDPGNDAGDQPPRLRAVRSTRARPPASRRFVYASSCSIYGARGDDMKTEDVAGRSADHLRTLQGAGGERGAARSRMTGFTPVFMRNATAFGASPRQRFDIVLNNLAGWAYTTGQIRMTSDGTPWRPLVHVEDICQAILCALEAPREAVSGEAFNVGDDAQNYRVKEIAEIVAAEFKGCQVTLGPAGGDNRSYRVSFAKIQKHMPAFRCRWSAAHGAAQLRTIFERIKLDEARFNAEPYTRLSELKYLQGTTQLTSGLMWTPEDATAEKSAAAA